MFQLMVVYESGKRYTFSLEELSKGILTDDQLAKLKAAAQKEIKKL